MLRFLIALIAACVAGTGSATTVSDMRVVGDAVRTRFVVELSESPDYRLLRLASPYRLVIDLPDANFAKPAEPGPGRGMVSEFRYGLVAPGKARIVLDLKGPVAVVNAFVLDPMGGQPARLAIDMVPTDANAFEVAARRDRPPQRGKTDVGELASPVQTGRPVVAIDPGHGGIDSGAVGEDGLLEKDVTLKFGLELARQLRIGGKLEPVLSRDGDDFLSLPDRVEVARRHQAALFVSIHADSVKEDYVRGATVYTLSDDASDALAAALAERENRSDILAGLALEDEPDEVADILFDLARRETRNISIRFAKELVGDIKGVMPLNANPWRRGSFLVLKAPEVPSVLLELGYLSNAEDEELFRSKDWPATEAGRVARAIEEFFAGTLTAGQ